MLKKRIAEMQQELGKFVTEENLASESVLRISRELDNEVVKYLKKGRQAMKINREKVYKELFLEYFGGNYMRT